MYFLLSICLHLKTSLKCVWKDRYILVKYLFAQGKGLNFHFGMSVLKIRAYRMDCRQIRHLKELIFLSNLRTEIWPNTSHKNFPWFWGSEMQIFQNLWFHTNVGSWRTEKFWNGGLRERSGRREKGVLRAARTRTSLSGEYPLGICTILGRLRGL